MSDEITIVRIAHRRHFTMIANEALEDDRLSLRAVGLLAWLLAKPDTWAINAKRIADHVRDGRDAVGAALRELVATGYLRRTRRQDPSTGRWSWEHMLYECPECPAEDETPGRPEDGFPGDGEQDDPEGNDAKPLVTPNTGFQASVSRSSGARSSGFQASQQRLSSKDSLSRARDNSPPPPAEQGERAPATVGEAAPRSTHDPLRGHRVVENGRGELVAHHEPIDIARAVADECGLRWDELHAKERRACTTLAAGCPAGSSPTDGRLRVRNAHARWSDPTLVTPRAVFGNWASLGAVARSNGPAPPPQQWTFIEDAR